MNARPHERNQMISRSQQSIIILNNRHVDDRTSTKRSSQPEGICLQYFLNGPKINNSQRFLREHRSIKNIVRLHIKNENNRSDQSTKECNNQNENEQYKNKKKRNIKTNILVLGISVRGKG